VTLLAHGSKSGMSQLSESEGSCENPRPRDLESTFVTARILDGKAVAQQIRDELTARVARVRERLGRPPALSIVLVGDDPASQVYVRNKLKTAEEAGMGIAHERLPATATLAQTLAVVRRFNDDPKVDGILVQSPLPKAMGADAEQQVFDAIDPSKDVDGFSPISAGRLVQNREGFAPCTPAGVIELLVRSKIPIEGKHAVVIGRSDIVGKPMAALLLHKNATVTVCHSRTRDLPAMAREGDILVAAIGRPAFVTRDFVKPGAVVIDVGINSVTKAEDVRRIFASRPERLEAFERKGSVLVGDVHPDVADVAGALTPVPGGVGPLTIAMLMANTVKAAELRAR
jgi:methylenetetrahydrofolate dehydrogenase (NADP+)/methenyltetrahydrofolate cyclohydrolase